MIKPYEKYKDSGLFWYGEIPEKWKIVSLKYQLEKIYSGGTPSTNVDSYWTDEDCEDCFPWVSISDITRSNSVLVDTVKKITKAGKDDRGLEIVPKGTLLLSIFASLGKTTRLGIDATINQAILGLVPKNTLDLDFFEYLLIDAERYIDYFSSHNTQDNLNLTKIKNLQLPIPSIEEQTQIANYLDYQTGIVDELIAKKERLVELLQEKRQSVINNAITKGLDPNAKMKDSGIEWLGEVPEEWNLTKIKYDFYLKARVGWKGLTSEEFEEESYAYLVTGTDFNGRNINWETCYQVNQERYEDDPFIQLENGDLLITKDGTIGKTSIVKDLDKPACLNSGIFVLRPLKDNVSNEFLFWIMNSNVFSIFNDLTSTGATIKHLYQNVFQDFSIAIPDISQQIEINEFLNKQTAEFDELIKANIVQIDNLKFYRQSIISEAVTGKVDLRDWKAPDSN